MDNFLRALEQEAERIAAQVEHDLLMAAGKQIAEWMRITLTHMN